MNNYPITKKLNYSILLGSMLIGGILTLLLGKDLNWDLANYHYYNAYALLHFRYDKDYWPAALNTFFNPTLDLFTYFLINQFPPMLAGFTLGAVQGITIWIVFKIALLLLPQKKSSIIISLIVAALGIYCPQFICGIGMSFGDLTVGIFVLGSVYFILSALSSLDYEKKCSPEIVTKSSRTALISTRMNTIIFLSGLLLGLGIGLKYIIAFYAFGMAAALLFLPLSIKNRLTIHFIWGTGVILGIAISAGYWMVFLLIKYHNPLFPFFNALFKSPFFPEINWHDTRFLPKGILESLLYPFYFSFNGKRTDDIPYRDIRILITYVLFVLTVIHYLYTRLTKSISINKWNNLERWFLIFLVGSFIVWEYCISYMRYAVILEMLCPIAIFILIKNLCSTKLTQYSLFFVATYSIVFIMGTEDADRSSWIAKDYFGISIPKQIEGIREAAVFFPIQHYDHFNQSPHSLAYMIPFFPPRWKFIGVPYITDASNLIDKQIQKKFFNTELSKTFLMVEEQYLLSFSKLFDPARVNPANCFQIPIDYAKRQKTKIFICQIT